MFDISKIYENIVSCYTYADVCDAEEIVKERHEMTKFEPVFLSGDRVTARKVALIRYQAAIFKEYYYNFAVKNGYDGTFNAFVAEFEEVIVKRIGQIEAFDMLYTSELIEFYVDVDLTLMAMTLAGKVREMEVIETVEATDNVDNINNVEDNVEDNVEKGRTACVVGISGATLSKIKDYDVVYCNFIVGDADKLNAEIIRVKHIGVDSDIVLGIWDITTPGAFTIAAKYMSKWEEREFAILQGEDCMIRLGHLLFNAVRRTAGWSFNNILMAAADKFIDATRMQYDTSACLFYKSYIITFLCAVLLDNGYCEEDLDNFVCLIKKNYVILK